MDPRRHEKMFDKLEAHTPWTILAETAERLPGKTALVGGEERRTYAELVSSIERLSTGFARAGFKKGDHVSIYMKNSLEMIETFYALQRLGVVVAWLNPNYRETEAKFIIANSRSKAVFIFEKWQNYDYLSAIQSFRKEIPGLETVVVGGGYGGDAAGVRSLADYRAGDVEPPAALAKPTDPSMIIYTSGTTGKSKGAYINLSQATRAGYSYSIGTDAGESDVFLGFLPMAHAYGCGALLIEPFIFGATLVVMEAFNAVEAMRLIQKEKVTIQLGAPAHYIMELNEPKRAEFDLSTVRAGLTAGQIAPEGLITRVQNEMGITISSFLGSSEVGPGLSIIFPFGTADLNTREKYIGYPIYGTRIKIIDPATGAELTGGEPGELLIAGWHVMNGYWDNPEETANQLKDGWLYTGDLVSREGDGPVRILGRIKEFINRGGFKVIPSELESIIVKFPGVAEAAVVGTANPVLGESICAVLRLLPGEKVPALAEVRKFMDGKVAPYKLPDELLILEDFPRMPGGVKMNRFGKGGVVELARTSATKEVWKK